MPNNGDEGLKNNEKIETVQAEQTVKETKKVETPKVETIKEKVNVENVKAKPVKKKGKTALIIVLLIIVLLVGAGVVFIFNPLNWDLPFTIELDLFNSNKNGNEQKKIEVEKLSNKELFEVSAENSLNSIVNESKNIGLKQLETIFNIGTAETEEAGYSKSSSKLGTDAEGDMMTINQEKILNSKTGDAAFTVSVKTPDGANAMEGGTYFVDDTMIIKPADATTPMVKYTLSKEQTKSFEKLSSIDRFALVAQDNSKDTEEDWSANINEFVEELLKDVDEKSFEMGTEKIEFLNEKQECDTVNLAINGEEAIDGFKGLMNLLQNNETIASQDALNLDELQESFDELDEEEQEEVELIMTTILYDDIAIGMKFSFTLDGETMEVLGITYENENERHNEINVSLGAEEISFLDMNVSVGGDKYEGILKIDIMGMFVSEIKSESTITDKKEETTMTYEIKYTDMESAEAEPMIVDGTIDYSSATAKKGTTGNSSVTFSMEQEGVEQKGYIKTEFESNNEEKEVTLPTFIEEAGVNATTYNELLDNLPDDITIFAMPNALLRTVGLISIICQ